jgi:hypothetical protein
MTVKMNWGVRNGVLCMRRASWRIASGTQQGDGPNQGSWSSKGDAHGEAGGRLMITSLDLLTLECTTATCLFISVSDELQSILNGTLLSNCSGLS